MNRDLEGFDFLYSHRCTPTLRGDMLPPSLM